MSPGCERWLVGCCVAISMGGTLARIEAAVRRVAASALPMASRNERSWLTARAMASARAVASEDDPNERARALTRVFSIAPLERAANEMDRRLQLKAKAQIVEEARAGGAVFYAVTTHQRPGKDHAAYQGMIVYDRNWRKSDRDPRILRFIESHGIVSLQDAMKGPYWIMTRPYCRHRFAPLDTEEVLNGTADTTVLDGAHRSMTPDQAHRKKAARRMLIRKRVAARVAKIRA